MASPNRSADPAGPVGKPARWLGLSLLSGSLGAPGLAASLVRAWGPVPVMASATVLMLAALYAVFWYAELERPVPPSARADLDAVR